MQLAGKLQAPIVHALRGKEFIEYDNPFDVGMTGMMKAVLNGRADEVIDLASVNLFR